MTVTSVVVMKIETLLRKVGTFLGVRIEKYYLFQIEIEEEKLENKPLAVGFDVVEITDKNIGKYDFSLFQRKIDRFKARLNNPNFRLYAVVESRLVCYYTWISYEFFIFPRYVGQVKKLQSDEAFLFDSACANEYKGRGLHTYMNIFRLRKIYENGRHKALVLVLSGNTPAINVQKKSGMKIIKLMRTFHCNFMNIDRVKFIDL